MDHSPSVEKDAKSLDSLYGNNSFSESFLDKTTLAKVALVVLAFLSIAAAITLGGWGETLLPHAFTLKHQIIAGCLLGVFGLALGLGVIAWQTCGSASDELPPETIPVEWSAEFGTAGEDTLLHRRKFTNQEGREIELFVYGEGAQDLIDGLPDNHFATDVNGVALQRLFIKNRSTLKTIFYSDWIEDKGAYRISGIGVDVKGDDNGLQFTTNNKIDLFGYYGLLPSAKIAVKDQDKELFSLCPPPARVKVKKADLVNTQKPIPTPVKVKEPASQPAAASFTHWEPKLSKAGDQDKFFRQEVKATDGTAVTLVYYGDDPLANGNKIAEHIRGEVSWQGGLAKFWKLNGPHFFLTYLKKDTTDTIFIGYGLAEEESTIWITHESRYLCSLVKKFANDFSQITVGNKEKAPLITLSRVVKK